MNAARALPLSEPMAAQLMPKSRRRTVASWCVQFLLAAILLQTLFFKFTAAEESVFIFSTLGMEPWGRIGSGVAELIAAILLLTPRTVVWGAALALGVIAGALAAHLTRLGIVVQNDGGLLFTLALIVFLGSAILLILRRDEIHIPGRRAAAEQ